MPLINWLSAVPAVGGAVHTVVSGLAAPVSSIALGRAGLQFFFMDSGGQGTSSGSGSSGSSGGGGGGGSAQQEPLLYRLSRDQPEEVRVLIDETASNCQHAVFDGLARASWALGWLDFKHGVLLSLPLPPLPPLPQGLLFLSGLAAFETRTLYANSSGDHLVGWANSSLRRLHELPPKNGRRARALSSAVMAHLRGHGCACASLRLARDETWAC